MNDFNGLNGLERCPDCYKLPTITFEDKGPDAVTYILHCDEHGHMAMGQHPMMAFANWNLYVKLSRKVA